MNTPACTIYLIRHAQSAPSRSIATEEWPLSPRGQAQATRLIPLLAQLGIGRIYTSPFRRCVETIKPFATASGLELEILPDLREIKLAEGFCKNFEEIHRKSWLYESFAQTGCESARACRKRMLSVLTKIAADNLGQTIAVSSHGHAIALFLNQLDPSFGREEALRIRNPDIFPLGFAAGQFTWERSWAHAAELAATIG